MSRLATCTASLILIAGCAVGPDFKPPDPPIVPGATVLSTAPATETAAGAAQHFVPGADISANWWRLFHSKPLNALVEQALTASPNLPAAQAALRQAQENVAAQRGSYYPSASAALDASRNLTPASASGNPYYSLITPQLNVSFVPDVFGANFDQAAIASACLRKRRFGALRGRIARRSWLSDSATSR
jgi:outer membrane protein TolC